MTVTKLLKPQNEYSKSELYDVARDALLDKFTLNTEAELRVEELQAELNLTRLGILVAAILGLVAGAKLW